MAVLMKILHPLDTEYVDRRFDGTKDEYFEQLAKASTLYIGNLSFYTSEDQIYELFSKVGIVQRVIMGLDRNTKTPCGFCFVMYHRRRDAVAAVRYLNGTKLDNRQLRADIDYGFEEGRQFGRGRSGGQVRDEFRTDFDAERGGFGRVIAQQLAEQNAVWQQVQLGAGMGTPATGADQVFFGQQQRTSGQQHGAAEAAAVADGAHEATAEEEAAVNPRLKGRGLEQDEEDGAEEGGPRKRQRIATPAEQYQQEDLQQQQRDTEDADEQNDEADE
eukprot:GHUV01007099.1.p1 GENE.GHUV01007099.1~~GHUV01007099.1.p1  ORF type:complete len:274 (+),score=116.75 GHUV01007099.1:449-1270(+)